VHTDTPKLSSMMFRESALLAVMPGLRFHPHSATRSWNRRATLEIQDYSAATICSLAMGA